METKELKKKIRSIGLALNASHNTVATDDINAEPDSKSWRIDNSKEIKDLEEIEKSFLK